MDAAREERSLSKFFFDVLKDIDGNLIAMIDKVAEKSLTYGELLEHSLKLAKHMKEELGIGRGDVVGIVSENRVEYFAPVLACFYLHAIVHPLNNNYLLKELRDGFDKSRPKVIFTSSDGLAAMLALQRETAYVEKIFNFDEHYAGVVARHSILENVEECPNADDNIAWLLSSSGTTGSPKCVAATQGNVKLSRVFFQYPHMKFSHGDATIGMMPFSHGFGFLHGLCSMQCRMKLIILQKFRPDYYLDIIQEHQVRCLLIVPTIGVFLAKHPLVDKYDTSSVDDIVCGAAPLGTEIQSILEKKFNCNVRQMYGMTETCGVTMTVPTNEKPKVGSVGKVVLGVECKVKDINTQETLGPNQVGELCVKGKLIMKGYYADPEATKAIFDDEGFLHSGDMGYYDEDDYFFVVDRLKDIIKYKSFQVAPAELEDILTSHEDIIDAGVIGVPDEKCGELTTAFVVKKNDSNLTEQRVIDYVAERISVQKRLHGGVKFIGEIPKNMSGKVLRRALREIASQNP